MSAKALADHESRFNQVDIELSAIRAELTVVKWICGTTMATTIAIFAMLAKQWLLH